MTAPDSRSAIAQDVHPEDAGSRILTAALQLLMSGGRDALTTRAVAAAAYVQAPTIYRLFGDKRGLLDAVAERGLAVYVTDKAVAAPDPDPLTDFRRGWDRHVGFGLAHPALFSIIWGDPQPNHISAAAAAGQTILRAKIRRLATAGLLRVSEERAMELTQAAGTGVVLKLIDTPKDLRDEGLSTAMREAVIAAIATMAPDPEDSGPAGAAITLRASLDQTKTLSAGERHLLAELLDRIVSASGPDGAGVQSHR